jgi:hypothetical protein
MLVVSTAALAACGDSGSPVAVPTPTPTPTPPTTVSIAEGSFSGLNAGVLLAVPFTTLARGRIEATVNWTRGKNDVNAAIVRGSCTLNQINRGNCPFVALAASATAKPERLAIADAASAAYTLYIGNLGPSAEEVSYEIELTSVGASGHPSVLTGQPARLGAVVRPLAAR